MSQLSSAQIRRYSRTIALPEMGEAGQARICAGSVMIVGAGALGSVVAMYLAAAGVGHIGIADFDTVDVSNLQRQIAYTEQSAGKPKVEELSKRMAQLNSTIKIEPYNNLVTNRNAAKIFEAYDVIVEGSDNPSTKHLVAKVCSELNKPCVVGGVSGWVGQIMTIMPGDSAYNDVFGDNPACSAFAPCGANGVAGPVPGIVGAAQAAEVIKLLANVGNTLSNRLFIIDTLRFSARTFSL